MKHARKNPQQKCPDGKYWISPHERKRKTKSGKIYIEKVKGYCCCYHGPYQKIAKDEKIPYDHLFFALTIYGEAGGENKASKRAIAWIIRNRFIKKRWGDRYKKIVVRPSQFNCWSKKDPNYQKLQHPGSDGSPYDKRSWTECKKVYEEVYNAPEKDNPIPGVCNFFSGKPDPKHPWEKNYFDLPGVPNFHFVKLDK
jgi:hypothetical protein